jgi:hypothetical protein
MQWYETVIFVALTFLLGVACTLWIRHHIS